LARHSSAAPAVRVDCAIAFAAKIKLNITKATIDLRAGMVVLPDLYKARD
jgi:hypothetical protein